MARRAATTKKTTLPAEPPITDPINPAEWMIMSSINHDRITYSRGEPLPMMTAQQLAQYVKLGEVKRLDAPPPDPTKVKPDAIEDYLRGSDNVVIRKLREHPLATDQLMELRNAAKSAGRSDLLIEVIDLAIDYSDA